MPEVWTAPGLKLCSYRVSESVGDLLLSLFLFRKNTDREDVSPTGLLQQ